MKIPLGKTQLQDKEIIEGLLNGDEKVIKYLFYDKCAMMFAFIVKEVFCYRVNKDELVNELYIYLKENDWQRVRQFAYRSRFTTWLSVVAVRYFICKRDELINSRSSNTQLYEVRQPVTADKTVEKIDLYRAISKLKSSRDRFVLIALEIEGWDEVDVARELGVTVANVYNIKSRAMKRLSNILTEYRYDN